MRYLYTEPAGSWLPGLPAGGRIFFQVNGAKELLGLITADYILSIAAHFKQNDLKRCNKDLVMLVVAPAGTINNIEPFVTVFSNGCFLYDLAGNIFVQEAID